MKRKFNSDGQQFHWYQQNEQSPPHFNLLEIKPTRHMTSEIHALAWNMNKLLVGLRIPSLPLLMTTYPKTYRPLRPICTDDATLSLYMSTKIFSINKTIYQIYYINRTSFNAYSCWRKI